MLEQLLQAVGLVVVAGGGLASIAYAIFKKFGEKWLDAKFEERLADYRHEQQKELEQLRFKINALLDRTTKLHQREFDVLPETWSHLNEAYWKGLAFVSPMQRYPDLNRMTDTQLAEFIDQCELDAWEREELRGQKDRNQYFIDRSFWHRLADTKTTSREFHVYLLKHGIFLAPNIKQKFTQLDSLIWDAIAEHEFSRQYEQIPRKTEKLQQLLSEGPKLLHALESEVQGRLWSAQDSAP